MQRKTPFLLELKRYFISKNTLWYWVITTLSVISILAVFFIPETVYPAIYIRSSMGLIFVLFLPGYAFIKMLFPLNAPFETSNKTTGVIIRFILSISLSLTMVAIMSIILTYTPWGIQLSTITLSLFSITQVFALSGLLYEYKLLKTLVNQL